MSSWIKVHRQITDHPLWKDKPFSRGQAFIDLLLMANTKEGMCYIDGAQVHFVPGEIITSEVKLSIRWGWSRKKVRGFLSGMERDGMGIKKGTAKYTSVTIVNWALYQSGGQVITQLRNSSGPGEEQLRNTNKNKELEVRKDLSPLPPAPPKCTSGKRPGTQGYADYVYLLPSEHAALVSEYGEPATARMIEILDGYKANNQKRLVEYRDDYRVIRNWVLLRWQEEQAGGGRGQPQRAQAVIPATQYEQRKYDDSVYDQFYANGKGTK